MWSEATITNAGLSVYNRWLGGEALTLTGAKGGDRVTEDPAAATDLVQTKQTLSLIGTEAVSEGQRVKVQAVSAGLETGYTLRQVGIWGRIGGGTPVLLILLQDEAGVPIPGEADNADFRLELSAFLQAVSAGSFSAVIDPAALVSAKSMQAALNDHNSAGSSHADLRAEDALLQAQIDQLVAPTGEAPSAAEVENARVGADATVYPTLGEAVRGQVSELKSALNDATSFYNEQIGIEFIPLDGSADSTSTPYEEIRLFDVKLIAGGSYKIEWSIPQAVSPYVVYCFLSDGHGNNLIQSRIAAGDTQKTDTYTASANNNDAYLYFTVGNTQTTVTASVTKLNAEPTRIENLESAVAELEETVETRRIEITNPDTGHYINKNGGYSASNQFSISQSFAVVAGETVEVVATGYNNQVAIIAQTNADYPYNVLALSRSSTEETYTYTAMEDMFVVITYDNRKPCTITVKKIFDFDAIPQIQEELRDSKWKYAFDRICCIGDSLTSGAYYGGSWGGASIAQNYPTILSRMLNTLVKNSGKSGASAKTWYTSNMSGLTLADYGTFIIWLGTNQGLTDTISSDVDPYDDYNDFADTDTGYLCRTICQIKATVPDAHIIICTVFSTSGDLDTTNAVINQIAEKYSLQIVDNSDLDNTNYPLYHSNAVHFNKAGNIFVADRIMNAMIEYIAPDGRNAEFGLSARTD